MAVSSLSSFFHFAYKSQSIGSWQSLPQLKQQRWPQRHSQFCRFPCNKPLSRIASEHPVAGHHRNIELCLTKKGYFCINTMFANNRVHRKVAYLHKTVCYQPLIFQSQMLIRNQFHDKIIINNYTALAGWTLNGFGSTFIRDFQGQILTPTALTISVTTAQTKYLLFKRECH